MVISEKDPGEIIDNRKLSFESFAVALANDYETIYVVDCSDDSYVEYGTSGSEKQLTLKSEGRDFYADSVQDCCRNVYPDDQQLFLRHINKNSFLNSLRNGKAFSLQYRIVSDGKPVYHFYKAIKDERFGKGHIIVGVRDIDEQMQRYNAIKAESNTFATIVQALAVRYEVIYYVNIITDEYVEYSSSEKYSKLEVGTHGKDFFGDTQCNMRHDIYPEDYDRMAEAMKKENLLNSLENSEKIKLSYRLILEGRPQYVTLFALRSREDPDHVIIAVENIDAETRRELAIKEALGSAIDQANRDALTGVKNKHAYVQAEMEMDKLIKNGSSPDFAVVICDVNELKNVNDLHGHTAGDEYIRNACNIICCNFKHSPVFRIGGDEFAVLLKGRDFDDRDTLMEQLQLVMIRNKIKGLVTVAGGISGYERGKDIRVQDVFKRADKAMYLNKQRLKSI